MSKTKTKILFWHSTTLKEGFLPSMEQMVDLVEEELAEVRRHAVKAVIGKI